MTEGRALGVDLGERRIGISLSDPTRTIAQPLPTLKIRQGKRLPVQAVADLVTEHGVTDIVVGLPLSLSGEETDWCRTVRGFGDRVSERSERPVHYIDERMTSVRAERAIRSSGLPKAKREEKERIDAAAAVLILQAWLDRESRA